MQQFSLCFGKVKKDCLKFIRSQETKADKFKNKEKMIKSFLIPLCFWISKKVNKKRPYFVGLAGGQGSGKTTIIDLITSVLKPTSGKIMIDKNNLSDLDLRSFRKKIELSCIPWISRRAINARNSSKSCLF